MLVAELDPIEQQTIALAGLFQALNLTCQCARQGRVTDLPALETCLNSLLSLNAEDAEQVYAGRSHLALGLQTLLGQLQRRPDKAHTESARYAAVLLFLERRLHAQPQVLSHLARDIAKIREQQQQNAISDPPFLHDFAMVYSAHISPLGPKLQVQGEPTHLRDRENADRIRALLLAAVRAAMLWRHWGGNRLHMVLFRGRYRRCTRQLLLFSQVHFKGSGQN